MAKCLVGANGGGKVTVAGLSAEALLTGNTVTVKQGAKEVQTVNGKLDILAWGGTPHGFGNQGWVSNFGNGTSYSYYASQGTGTPTYSFKGTPTHVCFTSSWGESNICGVVSKDTKGLVPVVDPSKKSITLNNIVCFVVLGYKE